MGIESLARRSHAPERMDDPDVSIADYRQALGDLARLNRLTATHRATLAWITPMLERASQPLVIADLGCGAGDLLIAIGQMARKRRLPVRLMGIDLNARAIAHAKLACERARITAEFHRSDVFEWQPDYAVDVVVTSQFTHHLDDEGVVRLLERMESMARLGWRITDLQRHWVPYRTFPWLARIARWHPIVRSDGTISIARGFRRPEWQDLLARAHLANCSRIRWHVPFRFSISREPLKAAP